MYKRQVVVVVALLGSVVVVLLALVVVAELLGLVVADVDLVVLAGVVTVVTTTIAPPGVIKMCIRDRTRLSRCVSRSLAGRMD